MHDPDLNRLVTALDSVVEWAATNDAGNQLSDSLEQARLRLHCLSRRLGRPIEQSPYLSFIQRLCAQSAGSAPVAIAAGA
ncbi:MAG: hypothetical protein H0W72_18065 [Planctomycetes bacterium]|nr:hypothetical protein [Planctomycetota bacterium]